MIIFVLLKVLRNNVSENGLKKRKEWKQEDQLRGRETNTHKKWQRPVTEDFWKGKNVPEIFKR